MSGWISAADRLPPSGVPVIAFYRNSAGMNRRIRAEYIAQNTREQSDDIDDIASEYDEETDTFYWTAGWYELGVWMATTWRPRKGDGHRPIGSGDTPLQATMRCIVDLHSAGAPR